MHKGCQERARVAKTARKSRAKRERQSLNSCQLSLSFDSALRLVFLRLFNAVHVNKNLTQQNIAFIGSCLN